MSNQIVGRAYSNVIPAMTDEAIDKVYALEEHTSKMPQVRIDTSHILHGGMYARTILIPAGTLLTGALIKVATVLIVSGHVHVFLDSERHEINGYSAIAASAHRKVAFLATKDTWMTMLFTSKADSITRAEEEFTDESHLLMSRVEGAINHVTITGE